MSEPTITRTATFDKNYTEFVIRIPDAWSYRQRNLKASLAALFLRLGIRVAMGL